MYIPKQLVIELFNHIYYHFPIKIPRQMTYHYTTNYFQDFRISNLRYIDKNIFIRNKVAEQTVYSNSYHEHEDLYPPWFIYQQKKKKILLFVRSALFPKLLVFLIYLVQCSKFLNEFCSGASQSRALKVESEPEPRPWLSSNFYTLKTPIFQALLQKSSQSLDRAWPLP